MILDTIEHLPLYEAQIPGASQLVSAFQSDNPGDTPYEVRKKHYTLKEDHERRFEVHFHTIDLMIAREGAEIIHICSMDRLTPAEALPNGGDGQKLDGAPQGSAIKLEQGYFCAIFPGEAHMVGGKMGESWFVDKWVVKIPCAQAFEVRA